MDLEDRIISSSDRILVTGASGFIGTRVLKSLLERGFDNLRCLTRHSSDLTRIEQIIYRYGPTAQIEIMKGNLLSREDCVKAVKDISVIYHLAVATDLKSIPRAFLNTVVTTRNLLDASIQNSRLKRFVNLSSLAVYTNRKKLGGRVLNESCSVEVDPELRGETAYLYAKVKQDEIVTEYGKKYGIPYVLLRPGAVYGPGKNAITGRVGIGTFGIFLHLGGSNKIPFTHVDNCAEAIVLAGLKKGIEREVFNIVDDDLPSSRKFLRLYKKNVEHFKSVYLPHIVSYLFCLVWEKYSFWSRGQLPPTFNRRDWHAYWKSTRYSNEKLKNVLGWRPAVSTNEGLSNYFKACKNGGQRA